jgi:hypothetical protein
MKDRLDKLLSIKSIVTILFSVAILVIVVYKTVTQGGEIPDQLWSIVLMIIAFYFGTQAEKNQNNIN